MRLRRTQGQTLVIALLVSFVLLVLGGVFIAVIARNIINVRVARERISADNLAEAGLRFAIDQLVNSEFGADWRPIPDNITATNDPDYFWLKPYNPADGTGGFTRLNLTGGRALLRVSYQPSGPVHLQPVIKIESVGLVGLIDPNDPTTFTGTNTAQRAERVAYLQVGTIDYLRFVMNREQRGTAMDLGASDVGLGIPYRTILGEINGNSVGGGSIFINGNLRLSGNVEIGIDPSRGERIYVAGEVFYHPDTPTQAVAFVRNGNTTNQFPLLPSNSTNFITANGIYRDGLPETAADGYPRAIAYLEPPRMDTVDPATERTRYVTATRDSGIWRQRPNGSWYNTGQYGYGRGVYINNAQDIQRETRGILGGYTLRGDWLNPGQSRFWNGWYYEPPGAQIELVEVLEPGGVRAQGFRITRNQSEPRDVWYDPRTGTPTNIKTLSFFYRQPNDPNNNTLTNEFVVGDTQFDVPFNGVIYAEGNVRIRGRIPSNRQITIVTNGTAYIDGNIVKGNERSALAIIARDYVCVNTTQFFARSTDSPATAQGDPFNTDAPYYFEVLPNLPMRILFSFGEDPSQYQGNFGALMLMVRHAAGGTGSFMNLLVNPSFSTQPFYTFNLPGFPSYLYPLGASSLQVYPNYEKVMFPLVPAPNGSNYVLDGTPGITNMLQFQLQPFTNPNDGFQLPTDNAPYRLSAVAIQPLDIKIQAALFAQEGSFFVIPGYWFNNNPQDLPGQAQRPAGVASPEFPFYGQPLDIQITIEGSIAENFTAALGDQTEWLRKWGWIPVRYGSSNRTIPVQHQRYFHDANNQQFAVNLLMRYDPIFRNPVVGGAPLRVAYDATQDPSGQHPGRVLPPIPRLPVCPKPIFAGDIRP
ncbi:MAG: hypothetical protein SNJ72_01620 [Fimbriimonadales bacterium]